MSIGIFLKLLLIVVILLVLAMLGLAIRIIIKKNGKFPDIHLSRNKVMSKKGITCANSTEKRERQNYKAIKIKKQK